MVIARPATTPATAIEGEMARSVERHAVRCAQPARDEAGEEHAERDPDRRPEGPQQQGLDGHDADDLPAARAGRAEQAQLADALRRRSSRAC